MLRGQYAGPPGRRSPASEPPTVVFAGRHIPEKRVPSLVPALAVARKRLPELRAELYGDGPERDEVLRLVALNDLQDVVEVPGFVAWEDVERALGRASCLALPSSREGYGMIVVEAAAQGTPSVVVAGDDNAAVELVEEGVNGVVSRSGSPSDLAAAIVRMVEAGAELRETTADWFEEHSRDLSLTSSLEVVAATYAGH